jgi:phage gp46-like protein
MIEQPDLAKQYAEKALQLQPENKRAQEVLRQIQ